MVKDDLYINCRFCPEFKNTCQGGATDCICYRCPRNLGQCLILKYCRETESVLNNVGYEEGWDDENIREQLDSVLRNIEGRND